MSLGFGKWTYHSVANYFNFRDKLLCIIPINKNLNEEAYLMLNDVSNKNVVIGK